MFLFFFFSLFFFFFKQKTAYEMCGRDWSSDVCSSDLIALLCHYSQTFLAKRVAVTDNLQCTVMEVKALPGLGTWISASFCRLY